VAPRPQSALHRVSDEGPSVAHRSRETFDDEEEDATDFMSRDRAALALRARAASGAKAASRPPMVTVQKNRVATPIHTPQAGHDGESTMALDVADLRDELSRNDDDRSDELDLFADENVAPPKR